MQKQLLLLLLLSIVFGCSEDSKPEPFISEVLSENRDMSNAVFDSRSQEYTLTYLDPSGPPFKYEFRNSNFEIIRQGEVGGPNSSSNGAFYTPIVEYDNQIFFSKYYVLNNGKILRYGDNFIALMNEELSDFDSYMRIEYDRYDFVELENAIALTFGYNSINDSEENTILRILDKNTFEVIADLKYGLVSQLPNQYANARGGFSITKTQNDGVIISTGKGIYKYENGEFESFLNEELYGRFSVVQLYFVDSKNRLVVGAGSKAEVYDMDTRSFLGKFDYKYKILGEDINGDYIIFDLPRRITSFDPVLYKLRVPY